jgi:hypothetical protein
MAAKIGRRSGSSTGNPSGSTGHTPATQSCPASARMSFADCSGVAAWASTMPFSRRGSALV